MNFSEYKWSILKKIKISYVILEWWEKSQLLLIIKPLNVPVTFGFNLTRNLEVDNCALKRPKVKVEHISYSERETVVDRKEVAK